MALAWREPPVSPSLTPVLPRAPSLGCALRYTAAVTRAKLRESQASS